jgi:hypothetical protein
MEKGVVVIPRLLQIELVPRSTWYQNVRSAVGRDVWRELRYRFLKGQCQICGARAELHVHEVWRYDDVGHVQRLVGFMCLCFLCHAIKHLGLAGLQAQRGDLDYSELVRHYCAVNECTPDDFVADRAGAFELWGERSQYEWTLDLSYLDGLGLRGFSARIREYVRAHPEVVSRIKQKAGL